jgi:hypothetical protein
MSVPFVLAVASVAALCAVGNVGTWAASFRWKGLSLVQFAPTPQSLVVQVLTLAWLALVLRPRLGRGRLVVAWPALPQRTGGRCAFHVGTSPGGARIDGVRVFLRCIVEARTPDNLWVRRPRLLWVAEARLPFGAHVGPDSHLLAAFDVPADRPETCLLTDPPVHWEVLVLGRVAGTEYADRVTVPVYAQESGIAEAHAVRMRLVRRLNR